MQLVPASMSGVVPSAAQTGASGPSARQRPKKATPVARSTSGVIIAAGPHPNLPKTHRPKNIMPSVETPVADEKAPMNDE